MTKPPTPPTPFDVFSKEEPPRPIDPTITVLKAQGIDAVILEKLEALSTVWGIPAKYSLSVAISNEYDNKIAALREAEGE